MDDSSARFSSGAGETRAQFRAFDEVKCIRVSLRTLHPQRDERSVSKRRMTVTLARRLTRRRALVSAAGAAAAGLALSANANLAGAQASAGPGSGPGGSNQSVDGIVVNGTGSASAPATSAVIQYILRYDPNLPIPENAASPAAGMGAGGYAGGSYPAPDEAALAPVAEALVNAGVPDNKVEIFPGAGVGSGPFGPGTAVVAASIEESAL